MPEFLSYPFMWRALAAGLVAGTVCSFLGIFIVLRKMAFFSAALSHAALAGIAIGLILGLDPDLSLIAFLVLVALGMGWVHNRTDLSPDSVIGVFFTGTMALGVVLIGLQTGYRADFFAYLFGDILGVAREDLIWQGVLGAVVVGVLVGFLGRFVKIALNRDLAKAEGLRVEAYDYLFMVLISLTVAISMKVLGALLVAALLILPSTAAKNLGQNLRQLFLLALIFSLLSVIVGLAGSFYLNIASGPSIVLTLSLIFLLSLFGRRLLHP